MSTRFADERLSAYLDGELSSTEAQSFEQQLERDPELRSEVEAFEAAAKLLREHGPVRAPAGFHARVLDAVRDEPLRPPWWSWLRRPFGLPMEGLLVAAAAVVVLWVALPEPTSTPLSDAVDPGAARIDWADPEPVAEPKAPEALAPAAEAPAALDKPKTSPKKAPSKKVMTPSKGAPASSRAPLKQRDATDGAKVKGLPDVGVAGGQGTGETESPKLVGGHNFRVTTSDPEAQFALQRIASRYQSIATNPDGTRLAGTELASGGGLTAVIQLPHDSLAAFERDLAGIGSVSTTYDKSLFNTDSIPVTIHLQLDAAGGDPEGSAEPL